ncbi:MAG: hypothetical protein ACYS5W_11345 [Planctomycetota bacterium]|jgi:hypothetical protein
MRAPQWTVGLVVALAVLYGLYHAVSLAWLCDDAFISFRYARNLATGHGLVFNAGEHVEGYTNFLWTLLIALGLWAGARAEITAQVLGVLCYLGTLWLLLRVGCRPEHRNRAGAVVPLAVLALSLHHHASSMASFGLETAMLALLVTAALVVLVQTKAARGSLLAGALLTLATLTRPDGALPYLVACVATLLAALGRRKLGSFWALVAPGIVVGVPYLLWKVAYYGDVLPNTFYARSAAEPYPSQGLWYVGLYFLYYPLLWIGLVTPLVLLFRRRRPEPDASGWADLRAPLWISAFTVPYLVYVVWVGGDFMFARFCLPVTPALCLGLQLLVPALGTLAARIGVLLLVAVSLISQATLTDVKQVGPSDLGIAEERNYYHPNAVVLHRHLGRYLHEQMAGHEPVVAVGGAAAMLAYYCEWPTVIELHGLTDRTIARRRIGRRSRVGHEKSLPLTDPYLLERGVNFVCWPFLVDSPRIGDRVPEDLRKVTFRVVHPSWKEGKEPYEIKLTMLTYSRRVMAPLAGAEHVRFTPLGGFLDDYIATMRQKPREEVALDYADFRKFYFDHNLDPARQRAFVDFLR